MHKCLMLILILPYSLAAETLNDCASLTGDARQFCRAMATLSVPYCDSIQNWGLRQHCHAEVVKRSRQVRSR
jgi:hypothetical protein